jgi:hypothetical protein
MYNNNIIILYDTYISDFIYTGNVSQCGRLGYILNYIRGPLSSSLDHLLIIIIIIIMSEILSASTHFSITSRDALLASMYIPIKP